MSRYSREYSSNGPWLEIYREGESVAFLQGEEAAQVEDDIERLELALANNGDYSDEEIASHRSHYLSQYDQ